LNKTEFIVVRDSLQIYTLSFTRS